MPNNMKISSSKGLDFNIGQQLDSLVEFVNNAIAGVDLSNYYNKSEIDTFIHNLESLIEVAEAGGITVVVNEDSENPGDFYKISSWNATSKTLTLGKTETPYVDKAEYTSKMVSVDSKVTANETNITTHTTQIATILETLAGLESAIADIEQDITEIPEYSLVESAATEGYAKSYQLTKAGTAVGVKINIPKDLVVQSGSVKTVSISNSPYQGAAIGDKYIELVLNDTLASKIYIPVEDLVDVYTAGDGVAVSSANVISARASTTAVADGNIASGITVTADGIGLSTVALNTTGITATSSKPATEKGVAAYVQTQVAAGKLKWSVV